MARTKNKKKTTLGEIVLQPQVSPDKGGSSILQKLMRQVQAKTGGRAQTLVNPEGELSISDAINNIIEPYRDTAPDYQAFKKLVMVACTAWNASILPPDEREKMLTDMGKLMPDPQSREDFVEIVKDLMKRKKKLYPNVDRMIVEFKVTDRGDDFHIAIASTLNKKEDGK
jgi:hypothetical protein